MDRLAQEFERRNLELGGVEWNVGLAIFALKKEAFYATLLGQDSLACEDRFRGLESVEARIDESVKMNLEFAERVCEKGQQVGLDIGFSIQPLIERRPDGSFGLHKIWNSARGISQPGYSSRRSRRGPAGNRGVAAVVAGAVARTGRSPTRSGSAWA
jgi:hypothetical protein